jgi:transcriptional regulator with XRE-family HTH domain
MKQKIRQDRNIGQNIRDLRKKKGMSQEGLAKELQLRGCEISRSTLAKIEAGIRHISVCELDAFCEIFGVDYNTLFHHRE